MHTLINTTNNGTIINIIEAVQLFTGIIMGQHLLNGIIINREFQLIPS